MAGGRQRRKRRARKARQATAAGAGTHISSLPDDIVLQIFLRLPSLATLVRAACACRAWRRAVASSQAFRSRFRALHPACLLGFFTQVTDYIEFPCFAPAHRRPDQDVLAALRGGDFVLTSLMDEAAADVPLSWSTMDCRDGYLLLKNLDHHLLATINPMARQRPQYIDPPIVDVNPEDAAAEHRGQVVELDMHLLSCDEDPMSFRLVQVFHDLSRVRAAVFSSETRDWRVLPWVEVAAPHAGDVVGDWIESGSSGTQAGGLVCWKFMNQERMLTLDTKTMEFSVCELPPCSDPVDLRSTLLVGETKNGTPCMVRFTKSAIYVWMRRQVDGSGADDWLLDHLLPYTEAAELPDVSDDPPILVAIKHGLVYLVTPDVVMSLCLETWKVEKLFPRNFHSDWFFPYFMAWPSSLVGDYGSFALNQAQDDPSSNNA